MRLNNDQNHPDHAKILKLNLLGKAKGINETVIITKKDSK